MKHFVRPGRPGHVASSKTLEKPAEKRAPAAEKTSPLFKKIFHFILLDSRVAACYIVLNFQAASPKNSEKTDMCEAPELSGEEFDA